MSSSANISTAFFLLVLGLPLGSFFNVIAHRLPRGQTPWEPRRSQCPHCGAVIAPRDNIPVLSWLILRGRCRSCGGPVAWRYPFFEAATALLFAAAGLKFGFSPELLPALLLISALVIVANADLERRIVPNEVIAAALLFGVPAQLFAQPDEWLVWTSAALIAFLAMLLVALAYPAGMGMGDVKLAAVLGLYLGRSVAPAMMLAFLLGTLAGLAVIARRGLAEGRRTALPFAPFMAIGGVFGLFWGDTVLSWYLNAFDGG